MLAGIRVQTSRGCLVSKCVYSFLSESVPLELLYALDESEEGSIAVNLLPLLLASRNSTNNNEKADR